MGEIKHKGKQNCMTKKLKRRRKRSYLSNRADCQSRGVHLMICMAQQTLGANPKQLDVNGIR